MKATTDEKESEPKVNKSAGSVAELRKEAATGQKRIWQ